MATKDQVQRALDDVLHDGVKREFENFFLALYGDPKPNEARAVQHFTNGMRDHIATHERAAAIVATILPEN